MPPATTSPSPDPARDLHVAGAALGAALDRRIVLHQLYAACGLILAGAVVGLVGFRVADAATGATVGTAVIGAGAALLPSGAAATARTNQRAGDGPPH